MLNLPHRDSQLAVFDQPLEPSLKRLLQGRVRDAASLGLAGLTHIVIIESGDSEADIIEAIGFSPLVSRLDGVRHQPDWDWIEKHEDYFELVYTVGGAGFAFLVFVQDAPGVLPELLALCRGGWSPDA